MENWTRNLRAVNLELSRIKNSNIGKEPGRLEYFIKQLEFIKSTTHKLLQELISNFSSQNIEIENSKEFSNLEISKNTIDEFLILCYNAQVEIKNSIPSTSKVNIDLPLPPSKIPVFDGDEKNWTSFYRAFKNSIEINQHITLSQKLTYSMNSLQGNSLNAIKHLE